MLNQNLEFVLSPSAVDPRCHTRLQEQTSPDLTSHLKLP